MYIYDFYNFDYDNSVSFKLGHEKLFTKEYFEAIVRKAIDAVKIRKKETKEKLNKYLKDELELSDDEANDLMDMSSECDYLNNVSKELINNYGFQDLSPKYTFVFNHGTYGRKVKELNKVIEGE